MKNLTIKIKRLQNETGDVFAFYDDSDVLLFSASCRDKKILGKDLFESIYSKADINNYIQVDIDQGELSPDDQKQFGNYVKDLFDSINKAMDKQFAPGESSTADAV